MELVFEVCAAGIFDEYLIAWQPPRCYCCNLPRRGEYVPTRPALGLELELTLLPPQSGSRRRCGKRQQNVIRIGRLWQKIHGAKLHRINGLSQWSQIRTK